MNTWTIAADAKTGTAQNSIDFKVGPEGALQDASAAMQGTGIDLSKNATFDMGYQGIAGGSDKIKLKTSGNVARVTRDIFHVTRRRRSSCNNHPGRSSRCAHGITVIALAAAVTHPQRLGQPWPLPSKNRLRPPRK